MPPNTVYVGRPSKWGNPYIVGVHVNTADEAVASYIKTLSEYEVELAKEELKGKNLCCWCPLDSMCHADILLSIANESNKETN